ncbi:MAG: CHC2 zinc finger domain-containing protein [Desulfobacteraceae bacterium]|jgi:hypothetical protein
MNVLDLTRQCGIDSVKMASSKSRGDEYWSACPDCGGDDRFHVWPDQNKGRGSYWCRGCGKTGDNIRFLMDFKGKSFKDACEILNIEIEKKENWTPRPPSEKKKTPQNTFQSEQSGPDMSVQNAKWSEKADSFVEYCHKKLLKNKEQLRWLAERGIKKQTVVRSKLGWNPGKDGKDLFRPRELWGLPTEMKQDRKKRLWLPMGLIIPLIIDGAVSRIRIRRQDDKPKYYVIPGSSAFYFLLSMEKKRRAYCIVETELDALMIDQEAGDLCGVIGLGTSKAKKEVINNPKLLSHLKQSAVILLSQDYDSAGAKGADWWLHEFAQSKRWPVPKGGDPGEAFNAGIDIREWIIAGLPKGWFSGQLLLGQKKKKGGVEDVCVDDGGANGPVDVEADELPDSVKELVLLLQQYPVAIFNTSDRLKILETRGWADRNWEVSKRISDLVYLNEEVFEWIVNHPLRKITGENIMEGIKDVSESI